MAGWQMSKFFLLNCLTLDSCLSNEACALITAVKFRNSNLDRNWTRDMPSRMNRGTITLKSLLYGRFL